jgi:hypothetical protein
MLADDGKHGLAADGSAGPAGGSETLARWRVTPVRLKDNASSNGSHGR